eukprot:488237-Pyramimonas_sp.AAC.1
MSITVSIRLLGRSRLLFCFFKCLPAQPSFLLYNGSSKRCSAKIESHHVERERSLRRVEDIEGVPFTRLGS